MTKLTTQAVTIEKPSSKSRNVQPYPAKKPFVTTSVVMTITLYISVSLPIQAIATSTKIGLPYLIFKSALILGPLIQQSHYLPCGVCLKVNHPIHLHLFLQL
jgi:hypothetical protein